MNKTNSSVALVTGASSGIGHATAKALQNAGYRVVGTSRRAAAERADGITMLTCDVTDDVSVAKLVDEVLGKAGRIDLLVNNAGIGLVGNIEATNEDDFERVMRVNVYSVYLVTKAFVPRLLETRGSIVNIGSIAGQVGVKQRFAYCASKGAMLAMTRQIAVAYPQRLRCNCIAPGTVQTPFVEGYLEKYHQHEKDKVREELRQRQPVGRLGTPEDVAGLVRYLCSKEADFMQGAVISLDGGWTAA